MDIRKIRFFRLTRVGMLAGILTVLSVTAMAHDPGLSAAEIRVLDDRIVAEVSFAPGDLQGVQEIESRLLTIEYVNGYDAVLRDLRKLELRSVSRRTLDQNSVHFLLEFSRSDADSQLPVRLDRLHISAPVLASLPRGHKQYCAVYDNENRLLAERMFSAESSDLTIDLRTTVGNGSRNNATGSTSFFRFLVLGVEHILTGYDHLAFLLALLLAGGSLRRNAKIITSFTVAHSLTLAMATFGVINIPATFVEPVIAASIVFVGLENLFGRQLAARWLVTFMFGLVHGLGFASALRELGIGTIDHGLTQAAIPLLSFNMGVELAQIAIAAVVLPLVWKLEQRRSFTLRHAPALSLLITCAGLYWLLIRTVF